MMPVTMTRTLICLSWRIPAPVPVQTATLGCRRTTELAHMRGLAHERTTALLQRKTKMMQRETKTMWRETKIMQRKMTMLWRKTMILIHREKPLCHPLPLCRVANPNARTQ